MGNPYKVVVRQVFCLESEYEDVVCYIDTDLSPDEIRAHIKRTWLDEPEDLPPDWASGAYAVSRVSVEAIDPDAEFVPGTKIEVAVFPPIEEIGIYRC